MHKEARGFQNMTLDIHAENSLNKRYQFKERRQMQCKFFNGIGKH